MSQFQFHYVFSGKPVRVKQISLKNNPNTLKLKAPNPYHMIKAVEPTIHKSAGQDILILSKPPKSTEQSCKSGNCLIM
jgi:hypothetical protein